jgi:hypothetical protein
MPSDLSPLGRKLRLPQWSSDTWVLLALLVGAAPWVTIACLLFWPDLWP